MWNAIKQTTLETKAPAFIHSEDDLIKRTIRELCDDKVEEIIVEGQEAFKNIKNLTKLMIPEQKIIVKFYNEKTPLFNKMDVESQVTELYNNKVPLPSGGSIVIDQTEALVAIDVNSGKATKEKSIEETAVATNVEAAKEAYNTANKKLDKAVAKGICHKNFAARQKSRLSKKINGLG